MAVFVARKWSQLWPGLDWAAEHYHPDKLAALRTLGKVSTSTLADHFTLTRQIVTPTNQDEGSYDTGAATSHVLPVMPPDSDERISAKKLANGGDVVISRLRSYLRQAAVIPTAVSEAKLSTEFIVLRSASGTDGWWLLPFLLSSPVQTALR